MSMKDEFLEEIREGDYVLLYYGENLMASGTVIKLTENMVRIKTKDGSPRISLDKILSYDTPDQTDREWLEDGVVNTEKGENIHQEEQSVNTALSGIQLLQELLGNAKPLSREEVVNWEGIKKRSKENMELWPREFRIAWQNIVSMFAQIQKNMPMSQNQLGEKMRKILIKSNDMMKQYPKYEADIYDLLAAVYFYVENYERAEMYYVKGEDYQGAAYAAVFRGNFLNETLDIYLDEYMRYQNQPDIYLYSMYARSACRRKSVLAMTERLRQLRKKAALDEQDYDELEKLSVCAFAIAREKNLPLQWALTYDRSFAMASLEQFIMELPEDWECIRAIKKMGGGAVPGRTPASKEQLFVSTIKVFHTDKLFGFIRPLSVDERDRFFHIEQVNTDDRLREILSYGELAKNLEVEFKLGQSFAAGNPPAAYDVRLTQRGAAEADRRLNRLQTGSEKTGEFIVGDMVDYDIWEQFGHIYVGERCYNVNARGFVDPYLSAYFKTYNKIEPVHKDKFQVAFLADKDKKGKDIALKVHFEGDNTPLSDYEIADMLRSKTLMQEEIDAWTEKKRRLRERDNADDQHEDYYLLPYTPLLPLEEEKPAQEKAAQVVQVSKEQESNIQTSHLPPLEPIPRAEKNRFENLPKANGRFYDNAHRYMLQGNLAEAERLYIYAIRAEDRLESSVADLVTVFLRDSSKVGDALDLMDIYGEMLAEDTRMNLLLQIYQKIPERPYRIKLCHLLDEMVQRPIRVSAKLHYVSLQGNTLRSLDEYRMALSSYRRWHQIYNAEVQYRGQSAQTQFAGVLASIKRNEAVCHYMLNEKAQAKELARELLRISASDETARKILEDTLDQTEIPKPSDQGNLIVEDVFGTENAKLSNFAQDRLDEIPLQNRLRSSALENGDYVGDIKQARRDVDTLLEQKSQAPDARSKNLLCAAKIVRTIEEKHPQTKYGEQGFQARTKEKYVGRSMAAYGDSVLLAQQEQDTARYAYLQTIELLPRDETDWQKALSHYISSYFLGKQDIVKTVEDNNKTPRIKTVDLSILKNEQAQDVGEFIIGMLELRRALKPSGSKLRFQMTDLIRSGNMIDDIVDWLKQSGLECMDLSSDGFRKVLDQADEKLQNTRIRIEELMERLIEQFLSEIHSREILNQMRDRQLIRWLCFADKNYLLQICDIMEGFRSYFAIKNFQHRVGRFDRAIQQCVELIKRIRDNPTQESYDVLRPALIKFQQKLEEARDRHYEKLPPEITLNLTEGVQPYLKNGQICVHLTISNGSFQSSGEERQLADNVELKVVELTPGVEYVGTDGNLSGYVYGGEDQEVILIFRINDGSVLTLGSLDVKIKCIYHYNAFPSKLKEEEIIFDEPVVFRHSQQARIENPFHKYIGQEMEDADMFKGRENIIKELIATMKDGDKFNHGHGTLMYGQTRAGKSSVRIHFTKRVRELYPQVIQVDMKNIDDGSAVDELSFYTSVLDVLDAELNQYHHEFLALMDERDIERPGDQIAVIENSQIGIRRKFSGYLTRLHRLACEQDSMIMLVADEFSSVHTAILNGTMSRDFMKTWKALMETSGLFMVCFGQDDTPQFAEENPNAFDRMEQKKLTYLDEESAKALMDDPIKIDGQSRYTPAALDKLYELTSGSAYLIIKVCNLLVEYLNTKGAERVTPKILQNFLSTRVFSGASCIEKRDFEPQIGDRADESLSEFNQKLLLDIARHSEYNGWAEIDSLDAQGLGHGEGQDPKRRLHELLMRLEERDVIEIEEGRRCRIKVALLSKWLLSKFGRG